MLDLLESHDCVKIIKNDTYIIYYSCVYKFPLVVVEFFPKNLPRTKIDRKEIGECFGPDNRLDNNCMLTFQEYADYIMYGGSFGHNAVSTLHKSSENEYRSTFNFSNISPHEITFSSGILNILKFWITGLIYNSQYKNIIVITGNIPNNSKKKFNTSFVNIPTFVYKIVLLTVGNTKYIGAFLIPNMHMEEVDPISSYCTTVKHIQEKVGVDLKKLIESYYGPWTKIKDLREVDSISPGVNKEIKRMVDTSNIYSKLIYAKDIDDLEKEWEKLVEHHRDNRNFKIYYDMAKLKLKFK
jgi:DNA/RNA endonuclease G (NUC1)